MDPKGAPKEQTSSLEGTVQVKIDDHLGAKNAEQGVKPQDIDVSGELKNTHSSTMADDFTRAGGFGARDDISSFLPVASDFTDFEASLRDARDYEEPQVDICRPGLGWEDVKK